VKDVAQFGAAIGREFPYGLIAAVSALPERHLRAALTQLVGAELIFLVAILLLKRDFAISRATGGF
jgi:hypothetical protein